LSDFYTAQIYNGRSVLIVENRQGFISLLTSSYIKLKTGEDESLGIGFTPETRLGNM